MDFPCIGMQPWWRHILFISQKYWCITDAWLMISDQADSFLEVINFSFKYLAYRIPLTSCFGEHSVIPKYRHQHVMRSQTLVFPSIPNCEVRTLVQTSNLHMKIHHCFSPLVKKWYLLQHRLWYVWSKRWHHLFPLNKEWFFPELLYHGEQRVVPLVKR